MHSDTYKNKEYKKFLGIFKNISMNQLKEGLQCVTMKEKHKHKSSEWFQLE